MMISTPSTQGWKKGEFSSKSWTKNLEFFTLRYEKLTKIYLSEKDKE